MEPVVSNASKSQVEITLETELADCGTLPPMSQVEQVGSSNASSKSDVEMRLEMELADLKCNPAWSCIYKVPQILYDANKEAYTPKVISIGPYHWGRKNLYDSHSLKIRYLQSFLKRTESQLGIYVEMAQGWEGKVRGHYDEECGLNSDHLVYIILMDGIFIVELTMQYCYDGSNLDSDGLLMEASLKADIMRDLMLLENQLPFFVLQGLADHSFPPGNNHGLILSLTKLFNGHFDLMPTPDPNKSPLSLVDSSGTCNILHLVDFIHIIIRINSSSTSVTFRGPQLELSRSASELRQAGVMPTPTSLGHFLVVDFILEIIRICCFSTAVTFRGPKLELSRSATELHQAGVNLGCALDLILTDIKFMEQNGLLQIPRLAVNRHTESLFRNIIAYEQCHRKGNKFRSYVILMDCLINTSQDVQLLVDLGIIRNSLGETEDVCTLFNNLYKMPMMDSSEFLYGELCQRLNKYSRDPWHKWKATWFRWKLVLRRDYFSSPWSIFSVIAAIILLGLTIVQTICSIKGVKW